MMHRLLELNNVHWLTCGFWRRLLVSLSVIAYFVTNAVAITAVAAALYWFVLSQRPVIDWIDHDGPGYRILKVDEKYIEVQWIQLKLLIDCQGTTEISIIGDKFASPIDRYPFIIDNERLSFIRRYALPKNLPDGNYTLRIIDTAYCNPMFSNRQVLRIPFEYKK